MTDPIMTWKSSLFIKNLMVAMTECTTEELLAICDKYITSSTPVLDKRK